MDFLRNLTSTRRRLDLLRTDVVAWNEMRATREASGMEFRNSQLQGVNLTWANLGDLDFSGSDFRGADLRGADLHFCTLVGSNFQDADLRGASLQGAQLGESNLTRANLQGANLLRADLNQVNLRNASLCWCILRETYCYYTDFSEVDLSWADLKSANLSNATFYRTKLFEANFADTNLSHTNLNMAVLDQTDFQGAAMYDTILAAVDLCGAVNLDAIVHEPPSRLSIGTDTLLVTLESAGGEFTPEQVSFFTKSGVAHEILASTRPVAGAAPGPVELRP